MSGRRQWFKRRISIGTGGESPCWRAKRIAQANGMEVPFAGKHGFFVFYGLALVGTHSQMDATQRAWTAAGIDWRRRVARNLACYIPSSQKALDRFTKTIPSS